MIRVLPKEVADKIAAGEVIENPVSIVKELIENSIDAGATSITCEIKKGGKEEIRVTDNGIGIPSDQVSTAFLRHATSKIYTTDDIKHIETLGFRGEALASISAVSRTELITKTEDEKKGTKLVIHGGEIISQEGIGCPTGTTIVVKDLFYNLPARLKFMKSEAAEAGKVIDMMSKLAITCPNIRFTLISNGKNLFTTNGSGDLKTAILSVYKERDYKELIEVDYESPDGIRVFGYVSRPSFTRTNRRSQFFFVNGRTVKSSQIEKGVDLGYRERMFEGRFPIAFLFLEVDPYKLDVNVHPNKKEVRFNDDIAIITAVEKAVLNAITTKVSVVKAIDTMKPAKEINNVNTKDNSEADYTQVDIKTFLSNKPKEENLPSSKNNNQKFSFKESKGDYSAEEELLPEAKYRPFDFDELEVGGTIFGTYIIATEGDNFYLFDQHAAHERVNYEKFLKAYLSGTKDSQIILTPFTFDVPGAMAEEYEDWSPILRNMGYSMDVFGDNTYIVREIPVFMTMKEAEDFINSFVDEYFGDRKLENEIVIDKLITRACKSSIKARDYIKDEEIKVLIEELKLCRNPFSCPHGRPTFIKLSKYDLEKMFKRIQ